MSEPGRPLRIAHLAFTALPRTVGGLEIVVDSLIRNETAAGHHVTLVTSWVDYLAIRSAGFTYPALPLPPKAKIPSKPFRRVGLRWPIAAGVGWHQRRHRFDLWHVHWLYPTGWMVHDKLTRAGVPVVMTGHGADLQVEPATGYGYRLDPEHDRRVRHLVPRAKTLTAVSASIEAIYLELGATPDRIHRISNGVHAQRLATWRTDVEAVRRRLNVPPQARLILSVGRKQPSKGFQFIPETLAQLVRAGWNVVWIVVGKNSHRLRELAEERNVASYLRLLPPIRGDASRAPEFPPGELADLYRSADVFAFPSLTEAFGVVVIEAMAAGVPVVANDVPGIRDIVSDGSDGLLCQPGDPAAMGDTIAGVLGDNSVRERLVTNGRKTAFAHDWSTIACRYLDVYREAIEEQDR